MTLIGVRGGPSGDLAAKADWVQHRGSHPI